ncbi:MAG: acylphosphatase [Candidatus Paceibacterota bacterium]|jgi:acylphosphatase
MNERLEAKITGRVQFVMFRDFVNRRARALGILGTVENMEDGSVFVVAEGDRKKLEELLAQLKKGSIFARVLSIEAKWLPGTGVFKDFRILFYGRQN